MEGLHSGLEESDTCRPFYVRDEICKRTTYLYAPNVLRRISPSVRPPIRIGRVRLRHAHTELIEHTREELVVRELDGVDADVLTQLDDDVLLLAGGVARAEHVPVFL